MTRWFDANETIVRCQWQDVFGFRRHDGSMLMTKWFDADETMDPYLWHDDLMPMPRSIHADKMLDPCWWHAQWFNETDTLVWWHWHNGSMTWTLWFDDTDTVARCWWHYWSMMSWCSGADDTSSDANDVVDKIPVYQRQKMNILRFFKLYLKLVHVLQFSESNCYLQTENPAIFRNHRLARTHN